MPYEMNPDSGTLFRNDRKESDKHPDYTGECLIDGVAYYMSAWLNESKKGTKFMAFKFKPKAERGRAGMDKARDATKGPSFDQASFDDDSIPF